MFRQFVVVIVLGLLCPLGATAAGAGDKALAAQVEGLLAQTGTPSASIAEIEGGRIVSVRAFGVQGPGVPASTRTLYNIASLAKPLSAEVMLRLASQGRIALDEPMSRFWIDPDLVSDPRAGQLTPRLALSHRTGFPNWRSKTSGLKFIREPGQYGYSGEGYSYVARYAAKRTATDFETLAQRVVLDPVGMRDTAYTGRPWFAGRIAAPTDARGVALPPTIAKTAIPADLVYTTAADYARFMVQVMRGTGLNPAIAADRQTIQTDMKTDACKTLKAEKCPDQVGFGLGWQVIVMGPHRYLTHTGRDDGLFTFAYLSPTNRTGLVILTNGENGARLVTPILRQLRLDPDFTAFLEAEAR